MERKATYISAEHASEIAEIEIDWDLIDRVGAELRRNDPPPGAFTVEQFSERIGCDPSTASKFLRKKVKAGELQSGTKFGDKSHRKYYWEIVSG